VARKKKAVMSTRSLDSKRAYAAMETLKYIIKRGERSIYEMRVDPNVLAAVKDFYEAAGDDAPTPTSRNDLATLEEHVLETSTTTPDPDGDDYEFFDGGALVEEQVSAIRLRQPTPNGSMALSLRAWLAIHKNDTLAIHLARGRKDLKIFDARGLKSQQRAKGFGPMTYEEIEENAEAFMEDCVSRSFNEVVAEAERDAQAKTLGDLLALRGRMNRTSSDASTSTFTPPARRGFFRRAPIRAK